MPAGSGDESSNGTDESGDYAPNWWWDFSRADAAEWVPTPARDRYPGPLAWDASDLPAVDRVLAAVFVAAFLLGVAAVVGELPFRGPLLAVAYAGL